MLFNQPQPQPQFGMSQPLFGNALPAQPVNSPQLFGQQSSAFGAPTSMGFPSNPATQIRPTGGLFGAANPNPGFGMPQTSAPSSSFFPAGQSGGGLFGSPATSQSSLFGMGGQPSISQGPQTLFGNSAPRPATSLFGTPSTSLFATGSIGQSQPLSTGGFPGSQVLGLAQGSSFHVDGMAPQSQTFGSGFGANTFGGSQGFGTGQLGQPGTMGVMGTMGGLGAMGGMGARKGTYGIPFQKIKDVESNEYFVHFLKNDQFSNTDKSTEEFRAEDYALRKANQAQFPKRSGMGYPQSNNLLGQSSGFMTSSQPAQNLYGGGFGASAFTGARPNQGLFGNTGTSFNPTGAPTGTFPTTSGGLFGTSTFLLLTIHRSTNSVKLIFSTAFFIFIAATAHSITVSFCSSREYSAFWRA